MKITVREGRTSYAMLEELGGRVLPNVNSELKVSKLLRRFKPIVDASDRQKNAIVRQYSVADDAKELPIGIKETRSHAWEKVLDDVLDIRDIPTTLKLTVNDLPVSLTTRSGAVDDNNRTSLAVVLAGLGPYLFDLQDGVDEAFAMPESWKTRLEEKKPE